MRITFEDMKEMNVPKYCRKLMEEEYPKTLEIYRGDMLCLTVDVEKASKLSLVENRKKGPVYEKYIPMTEEHRLKLRRIAKERSLLTPKEAFK